MNKKILNVATYAFLFFAILLLTQSFFGKKNNTQAPPAGSQQITVSALENEYAAGKEVKIKIHNYSDTPITITPSCAKNPFRVLKKSGEEFVEQNFTTQAKCEETAVTIEPQKETVVSYSNWNHALFGTPGIYKIEVPVTINNEVKTISSPEFTVVEAGIFRKLFRILFYQPLYNLLVLFINIVPGKNLGFAIILLTLVIRVILLVPSQRAMVSQKRMQEVQPKLDAIKKKYEGNQERIAQETMNIWKEHKVNPFGSCLPLIIQFPVLIGLFYVIQNGLNPDNVHLLYGALKNVDLTNINTNFLGILELTTANIFVLPLIIGALQFAQLKLATMKKKKPQEESGEKSMASEMESANKMMIYIMPVMIALFTTSVPAGVGLYWGVSTLFALGQQLVVNRKT